MSVDGPAKADRPRTKRMLPSVSDVVRELQADAPSDPSLLFKIARQVCAEELGRVKLGKEAVALDVLVERARRILDPAREASQARREDSGAFDLDVPTGPIPPPRAAASAPGVLFGSAPDAPSENEDPFNEATAAIDLGWDAHSKDSPLSDPGAADAVLTSYTSAPSASKDTESESEKISYEPRKSGEIEGRGPGDETIVGLERDAHGVDLQRVAPRGQVPSAVSSWGYDEEATEGADSRSASVSNEVLFAAPPAKRSSLLPMLMIIGGAVALLAVAYLAVGRRYLQDTERSTAVLSARASQPRAKRGEVSRPHGATTSSPAPSGSPAPAYTKPAVAVLAPLPDAGRKTGTTNGSPVVVIPPPATRVRAPQPTAPPAASIAARPSPVPVRMATATEPSRNANVQKGSARAGALASPDWAGKPPTYVIHFTSYKDRGYAEKDAARLSQEFGRIGHAVSIDLGGKGVWYRAVLGDFGTVEEAQEFRAELASRKTPSLGLVYYLVSP